MLTPKQELLRDYLTKRLGYEPSEFLEKYLAVLSNSASSFKYIRAKEPVVDENGNIDSRIRPCDFYSFDGMKWVPDHYSVIDFLIDEYKLKKNKEVRENKNQINSQNALSATDLAMFEFCPVSYAISKTFEIEVLRSSEIGTGLHEDNRLVNIINQRTEGGDYDEYTKQLIEKENKEFFEEIKSSELIYSGHNNSERKYFMNSKGNFVGQPDYVFQNKKTGEKFIVEEKFKIEKIQNSNYFYNNHKIQLYSYLYGLDHFDAKYGYLVYWRYSFDHSIYSLQIQNCFVHKLEKTEKARYFLNQIYARVKDFNIIGRMAFQPSWLNPNKCANCVVGRYCGHKTNKFPELRIPYSHEFLKTYYAPYPQELKTDNAESETKIDKLPESSPLPAARNKIPPQEEKDILNSLDW